MGAERGGNGLQNPCSVFENLVVPEPENAPSSAPQRFVPKFVLSGQSMLSAVGLDDQPRFEAGEINNVGRDCMLPSEPPRELLVAKAVP